VEAPDATAEPSKGDGGSGVASSFASLFDATSSRGFGDAIVPRYNILNLSNFSISYSNCAGDESDVEMKNKNRVRRQK